MSNSYSEAYENPQPSQVPPEPPKKPRVESNGLGMGGFIFSLIGLLTGGLLSIFGLGLSLFGLRKKPREFAIAGTVIGLIGLVELVICGMFIYDFFQAIQAAQSDGTTKSMAISIASEVADEWERSKELPSEAEGQVFVEGETDLFKSGFRYETDGRSFSIRGAGLDHEFDTEDDVTVGPFKSVKAVSDAVEEHELGPSVPEDGFEADATEDEADGVEDEVDAARGRGRWDRGRVRK